MKKNFVSLAEARPDLAKEWNYEKNGDLKPEDVSCGSNKKVWWKLPYDVPDDYPVEHLRGKHFEFEWIALIGDRNSKNLGCPFLSGQSVWNGFNDLASVRPDLAKQWHPTKNGNLRPTEVAVNSMKKVWWLFSYDVPMSYSVKHLKGIKTLGSYSAESIFANCNIQKLVLPPQIKSIGMAAFQNNNIQKLILPDGLEVIESNAFFDNPSLEEVIIPESVTKIKENAFPDIKKIHVKKYIPDLEFAITQSYIYSDLKVGTVTIESNNRELIIPKHPKSPIGMRGIIHKFIEDESYEVPPTYIFAHNVIERQETALRVFAKTQDKNAKMYLKKYSRMTFKRLMEENRNEEAIQMVRNDLMSKRTLREILPEIAEYPDVCKIYWTGLTGPVFL